MKTKIVWKENMAFEADLEGFRFMIDAHEKVGGQNRGPMPKGLTLVSLAGCTGMDVVSILKKMRVELEGLEIETEAELAGEHPKKFEKIVITYRFSGQDLPEDKLEKAIRLSQERYCGVSASLKPAVNLETVMMVNDRIVDTSAAAE